MFPDAKITNSWFTLQVNTDCTKLVYNRINVHGMHKKIELGNVMHMVQQNWNYCIFEPYNGNVSLVFRESTFLALLNRKNLPFTAFFCLAENFELDSSWEANFLTENHTTALERGEKKYFYTHLDPDSRFDNDVRILVFKEK
mgnify:CR=1 FL=1